MLEVFLYCVPFGALSGIIAGLLGVGGGIVIVPYLAWLFANQGMPQDSIMHMAVATSLGTIIVTSLSAIRAQHKRGAIDWPVVKLLVPGILLGAWLGASVAHNLPNEVMRLIFGCFLVLVSGRTLLGVKTKPHRELPRSYLPVSTAGGVIGLISSLVGIGGGTMMVPYMSWHNVPMKNAVAMGSACGLPIALSGAAGFIWLGFNVSDLPQGSLGYVYMPAMLGIVVSSIVFAPLGVRLAHSLPADRLKMIFSVALLLIGLNMLIR